LYDSSGHFICKVRIRRRADPLCEITSSISVGLALCAEFACSTAEYVMLIFPHSVASPQLTLEKHMKTQSLFALSFGLILLSCVVAQSAEPAAGIQVEQILKTTDGADVGYLLYLPENYALGTSLPVMLFLHGRGESDGPLSVVAKWGPPLSIARGDKLPYILISPQCPKEDNWSSPTQQTRIAELLEAVINKFGGNKDRVYLTGLSMGGSGSWRMAADQPERFAAVAPICGRGQIADAGKLKSLPIWVFCGDQDGVFKDNEQLVKSILEAGSQSIRFTSLENVGHNSWSAAYASPDLYQWLDRQSRVKK
jgi:predicted peptidase